MKSFQILDPPAERIEVAANLRRNVGYCPNNSASLARERWSYVYYCPKDFLTLSSGHYSALSLRVMNTQAGVLQVSGHHLEDYWRNKPARKNHIVNPSRVLNVRKTPTQLLEHASIDRFEEQVRERHRSGRSLRQSMSIGRQTRQQSRYTSAVAKSSPDREDLIVCH
jgi:hypothetical protein